MKIKKPHGDLTLKNQKTGSVFISVCARAQSKVNNVVVLF